MKTKLIIISIIVLILMIASGIYVYKNNDTLILQGEVEVKTVDLSSKLTGRVLKINVQKGDKVKKGDVLIMLDTPEISAKSEQAQAGLDLAIAQQEKVINGARNEQIAMAKSSYELAEKTYTRLKNLHSEGIVPAQKLDEAKAKYDAAKEQYNMLASGSRYEDKNSAVAMVHKAKSATKEVNSYLKENKIIAPIDGIITDVTVEEGELVGAGYPIITLIDENDVWITFNLREDLLAKFKTGTEFNVNIPAVGRENVKVRINYISVLGNYATWRATKTKGEFDMKTFEVRAVPVEPISDLRAGMSAIFDWKKI